MRKRRLLLAAGASLATVALTMGTAMADPVPAPPPYPPVVIVGAQTTQDLFDTMCNKNTNFRTTPSNPSTRICQSWDVDPQPSNIVTRDPVAHPECSPSNPPGPPPNGIPRPKQGGDGTDKQVAFPSCIDVSRVVTDDSHSNAARAGKNLTYIPMATDVLTYAIRSDSDVPADLTNADLKAIYTCDPNYVFDKVTGNNHDGFQPLLGSFGAGNRTQLMKVLGITNDSATYTNPGQPGECITDKDSHGVGILANDGRVLTNSKQLITYSAAPWLAQVFKAAPDIHGNSILGSINGISPGILNNASFASRTVYNVISNSAVAGAGPIHDMFVGTTSKVCQDTADITRAGFSVLPGTTPATTCGDTSIHTP